MLTVDASGGRAGDLIPPISTINAVEWPASHGVYTPPYAQEFLDFVHRKYTLKVTVAGSDPSNQTMSGLNDLLSLSDPCESRFDFRITSLAAAVITFGIGRLIGVNLAG